MLYKALIVSLLLAAPPFMLAQTSSDWERRYGFPDTERFTIQKGIHMTVFYSTEGKTCKTLIEADKPQPASTFEEILKQMVPIAERGELKQTIGLSSNVTGISSAQYERVHISRNSVTLNNVETVDSATIVWNGIQCKERVRGPIEKHQPTPPSR